MDFNQKRNGEKENEKLIASTPKILVNSGECGMFINILGFNCVVNKPVCVHILYFKVVRICKSVTSDIQSCDSADQLENPSHR